MVTASLASAAGPAHDALQPARERFTARVAQLLPGGVAEIALPAEADANSPVLPASTAPGFVYWETLGFQLPLLTAPAAPPAPDHRKPWDGALLTRLGQHPVESIPDEVWSALCPHPEALDQLTQLRGFMAGRKLLLVDADGLWLPLFCAAAGAAEITLVSPQAVVWSSAPALPVPVHTLSWSEFTAAPEAHAGRYDVVLSYGTLAASGLGRDGGPLEPLGDLFRFMQMAQAMQPDGLCTIALPTGQDLTLVGQSRVYGQKRIRALAHAAGLSYQGVTFPTPARLADDPLPELRSGWSLAALGKLPLGAHRQPVLCFARAGWSPARFSQPVAAQAPVASARAPVQTRAVPQGRPTPQPVLFVIFDEGGSMKMRGRQVAELMDASGQPAQVLLTTDFRACLADLHDRHIVFVKEFPRHLGFDLSLARQLRAQGNVLVCDAVDSFCFDYIHPLMRRELLPFYAQLDALIHCSTAQANQFRTALPHVQHVNVPHQWDHDITARKIPARKRFDRLFYSGVHTGLALDTERVRACTDIVISPQDFWTGMDYAAHLSFRVEGSIDFLYKPSTKLATAAASQAILVTSRDVAVTELVAADYPFYVRDVEDVLAMSAELRQWTPERWAEETVRLAALRDRLDPVRAARQMAALLQALPLPAALAPA